MARQKKLPVNTSRSTECTETGVTLPSAEYFYSDNAYASCRTVFPTAKDHATSSSMGNYDHILSEHDYFKHKNTKSCKKKHTNTKHIRHTYATDQTHTLKRKYQVKGNRNRQSLGQNLFYSPKSNMIRRKKEKLL